MSIIKFSLTIWYPDVKGRFAVILKSILVDENFEISDKVGRWGWFGSSQSQWSQFNVWQCNEHEAWNLIWYDFYVPGLWILMSKSLGQAILLLMCHTPLEIILRLIEPTPDFLQPSTFKNYKNVFYTINKYKILKLKFSLSKEDTKKTSTTFCLLGSITLFLYSCHSYDLWNFMTPNVKWEAKMLSNILQSERESEYSCGILIRQNEKTLELL